ncbi:MAG: hypothetical protein IPG19_13040 [Burkholderiales bacterium]|nr:hypothetical protein [Burkholderiales bacterium]
MLESGCGWGALAGAGYAALLFQRGWRYAVHRAVAVGQWAALQHQALPLGRTSRPTCACRITAISAMRHGTICSIEMVEAVGQACWPQYFHRGALAQRGRQACVGHRHPRCSV